MHKNGLNTPEERFSYRYKLDENGNPLKLSVEFEGSEVFVYKIEKVAKTMFREYVKEGGYIDDLNNINDSFIEDGAIVIKSELTNALIKKDAAVKSSKIINSTVSGVVSLSVVEKSNIVNSNIQKSLCYNQSIENLDVFSDTLINP